MSTFVKALSMMCFWFVATFVWEPYLPPLKESIAYDFLEYVARNTSDIVLACVVLYFATYLAEKVWNIVRHHKRCVRCRSIFTRNYPSAELVLTKHWTIKRYENQFCYSCIQLTKNAYIGIVPCERS
jgi:hypothetical protein